MNLKPIQKGINRFEVQIESYLTYVICFWPNPFIEAGYEIDEFILIKDKNDKNVACFNSELSRFLSVPERFTSMVKALRLNGRI
jgi:hypothetical protein